METFISVEAFLDSWAQLPTSEPLPGVLIVCLVTRRLGVVWFAGLKGRGKFPGCTEEFECLECFPVSSDAFDTSSSLSSSSSQVEFLEGRPRNGSRTGTLEFLLDIVSPERLQKRGLRRVPQINDVTHASWLKMA